MIAEEQMKQYWTHGYFITGDAVKPGMLEPLREATKRMKAKVQSGKVDVYTHWAILSEPWVTRGLFAPEFGELIFAEYLVSKPVVAFTESFLEDPLRLRGVVSNLIFTNSYNADYGFG